MIIGLIGLGEMGSEIGRFFVKNGLDVISVFNGRSEISINRAVKYGIKDALSVENFSKESDIVISIIQVDKHHPSGLSVLAASFFLMSLTMFLASPAALPIRSVSGPGTVMAASK